MFIFSNLATSIDGKIATTSREQFLLGTPKDRDQMQVLRKRSDAILIGASTLRAFKGALRLRKSKRQPINIILSSSLEGISPSWKFFKGSDIRRLLIVTERIPPKRLAAFSKSSVIVRIDKRRATAPQIIKLLNKLKVKRLLVEGGGGVMWDFVSQGLIDEFHITLVPRIIGGKNAPTLVEGEGFSPAQVQNLRLKSCKRIGQELFLIYRRK